MINDLTNLINHVPRAIRNDIQSFMSMEELFDYSVKVKSRDLPRKEFVKIVTDRHAAWVAADREARTQLPGFEMGQMRTCACEHWVGKTVEIVDIDTDRHCPIKVLYTPPYPYDATTYWMKPEWFMA